MTLELRAVDSGLPGVASWWDSVLESSRNPSPFASHAWLSTWWELYGEGKEARVLALQGDGEPVGGVAFYLNRRPGPSLRELRLIGDRFVGSEGLDFLVKPGFEEEAARRLGHHLAFHQRGWDIAQLEGLRPQALLLRPEAAIPAGRARVQEGALCPFLPLCSDQPVKARKKVNSKTRQLLEGRGLRFARCTTEAEIEVALADLFTNHQARWQARGQAGGFADPRKREFYRRVAPRLFKAGRLELYALWEGERARAVLFGASAGRRLFFLQSGFDPQLATFGPGSVLLFQILRDAQARGFERFDFMKGDEAYKFQWTAEAEPLMSLRAAGPGWRGRLAFARVHIERQMTRAWRRLRPRPAPALAEMT